MHGNVYKLPPADQDEIDDRANDFLIGVDVDELPENEQENARNLTRSIYVVQQGNVSVTMNFVSNVDVEPSSGGGTVNAVSALNDLPQGESRMVRVPFAN